MKTRGDSFVSATHTARTSGDTLDECSNTVPTPLRDDAALLQRPWSSSGEVDGCACIRGGPFGGLPVTARVDAQLLSVSLVSVDEVSALCVRSRGDTPRLKLFSLSSGLCTVKGTEKLATSVAHVGIRHR